MSEQSRQTRILVVDDEPVMRMLVQSVLQENRFEVRTASSAEDAFELLEEDYEPDLLLLDVLMSGMSGFEACQQLRQDPRFVNLPIILLTGLDDQLSIDEAYRCGATDFITKPINVPLLPHRLRYLLRSAGAFQELVRSQTALQHAQRIALLGSWTVDSQGNLLFASQMLQDILGEDQLPVPAYKVKLKVHPQDYERLWICRQQLRTGRSYQIDYRLQDSQRAGQWSHMHERGFPNMDSHGQYQGAYGFTQDITERVMQEERIRYLAWHDQLTGLNNRNRLQDTLEELVTADTGNLHITLAFLQVANLGQLSSVLGPDVADMALKVLSGRLKGLLERPDTFLPDHRDMPVLRQASLARYGEHAFVITVPNLTEAAYGRQDAEALLDSLCQPMLLDGQEFIPKAYMGLSAYPSDATTGAELVRCAMLVALQAAQAEGERVSNYAQEHDLVASRRMKIERGLRQALEQGTQLLPYYQPKICASTGLVLGAEVLLRWQHPEWGMVQPGEFIPVAERSGLIYPISEWLVSTVCDSMARWRQDPQDNTGVISINMPAEGFYLHDLCGLFDRVLARTGIPAECLTLELTESALMQNAETARQVIGQLQQRGLHISLDDFGTGFSSLGYLSQFPIDEIKIDRSFVISMDAGNKERSLVHAIISMGHALGMKVVAEGVETEAQADALRHMGCEIFQGYHFARPMPEADFLAFCRRASNRLA